MAPERLASLDEASLVERARQGGKVGEVALSEIVRRHQVQLVRLVRFLVGSQDAAEDVVQMTFIRAYAAFDRYRSDKPLIAWLRVIATRLAYNYVRDRNTRREYEGNAPLPNRRSQGVSSWLAQQEASKVLAQLPYSYREVLVLHYVDGASPQEMEELLNLSGSATRMRLKRAKEKFLEQARQLGVVDRKNEAKE